MADSAAMVNPLRLGMTLEQCWHRVPGGTATSAVRLASVLDARDDVDVIGIAARHRHPPPPGWEPEVEVINLPVPRPPLYECWHHLRWPHVEDSTGPLDVVHATGMAVPAARVPLVVTVHDLAFLHYPDQPTRRGLRFFHTAIDRARRHAAIVHCPSQATADDCAEYGFAPERLRIIPWGLDWEIAGDDAVEATRARHGLDRRYVLFAGTLEPRKNLPRLIEAFERIDPTDVDLVLVGPEGWGDKVVADGTRIRALGHVPPTELAPLYRGAAVFCYPSLFEGFGLPVLEAMSQGTAVITSAATATAEVGGQAVRVVDPTSVDGLAEALSDLLGDPTEADRLGEAGLVRSREFGWSGAAQAFRDLYAELAA